MAYKNPYCRAVVAIAILLSFIAIGCFAQEPTQDHSCTVDVAGAFAVPAGKDGHNFDTGWGLQAGGGFAVSRPAYSRGFSYYLTANFMYERFRATDAALALAKASNPILLAKATSAHAGFSAVTIDPAVRYAVNRRFSIYGVGGFGWFRRGVGFNGANPATLTQSNGATLDRLASNSGAFDFGGGANFGITKNGGLMLFAEARVYRGLAINSGSTLVPISVGIRW
jgi:hypothetical protein